MINVVIVDDHPAMRQGISLMLDAQEDIRVVGTAANADTGESVVRELCPDVVLMDLSMPGRDGASATSAIMAMDDSIAVVALTSFSDEARIADVLDAGAIGYLLKGAEPDELVGAVRAAARGESPLHPKAARVALTRRAAPRGPRADDLTERERAVLLLLLRGHTNSQIGRRLGISERTVKGHLTHAFDRIGVSDRTSAALWAQQHLVAGG
jgi:DNA-binding NarL/FixJ family response regulator